MKQLIVLLGEDPVRDGLKKTPERVAKSLLSLTGGYGVQPMDVVGDAIFDESVQGMVIVKDIEFYSMCEHHMLPFFGKIHIGYVPSGRIIGLSKLPRLVEVFARRLQVQERLTGQIAEAVWSTIGPTGVGVFSEASHLCMMMRGIQKQLSTTVSSSMLGSFLTDAQKSDEFFRIVLGYR